MSLLTEVQPPRLAGACRGAEPQGHGPGGHSIPAGSPESGSCHSPGLEAETGQSYNGDTISTFPEVQKGETEAGSDGRVDEGAPGVVRWPWLCLSLSTLWLR